MGAVGTHFRMSVADFFGRSARGWVTLRLGEALVVMDRWTGWEFEAGGHEEEMAAAATHFRVLLADFFFNWYIQNFNHCFSILPIKITISLSNVP
jgi:hypothetical protein